MPFHLYILYSEKLEQYYIGTTGKLHKLLEKHIQSSSGFTSKAQDWKLVYSEVCDKKKNALERVKEITG